MGVFCRWTRLTPRVVFPSTQCTQGRSDCCCRCCFAVAALAVALAAAAHVECCVLLFPAHSSVPHATRPTSCAAHLPHKGEWLGTQRLRVTHCALRGGAQQQQHHTAAAAAAIDRPPSNCHPTAPSPQHLLPVTNLTKLSGPIAAAASAVFAPPPLHLPKKPYRLCI
jgi:hypothetical protein